MSLFKNVNVVYLYVQDWEAAKKFYSETLEWPLVYCDDTIGWCEYGAENATHVAINKVGEHDPAIQRGNQITITFTVEDVHAATKELRARGVRCEDPVLIPGVVHYGTFYDPEGNRFQFASSET